MIITDREAVDFSNWREYVGDIESPFALRATNENGRAIDAQIGVYFKTLFTTGGKTLALKSSALQPLDIYNYRKKDPQFAAMESVVLKLRSEMIVEQIEREALEGNKVPVVDKKSGEIIGYKTSYETPIRLAMLKRHSDGAYDKDEGQGAQGSGVGRPSGVVVVPAGVPMEEWEKKYGDKAKGTYRPSEFGYPEEPGNGLGGAELIPDDGLPEGS